MLMQRKGISEDELEKKVRWLGQTLMQRDTQLSTYGLPSVNTLKIGVKHLGDYLTKKRDIVTPLVSPGDHLNYIMLAYYRNPLN